MSAIQLILGPMFSGKTTELLRRARRHTIANRKTLLIKYAQDTRYDEQAVCTHDGVHGTADTVSATLLAEVDIGNALVICIDEGQFYPDLAQFCQRWASDGKVLIVAALDGTFHRTMFPPIIELLPLADELCKLNAVCTCGQDAPFTRLRAGNEKRTEDELIGGAELYVAQCRKCYENLL